MTLSFPRIVSLLLLIGTSVALSGQEPAPGYNSHWRNADDSEKIALEFGGGYDATVGAGRKVQGPGWNFVMGAGYRINRHIAVLGEYGFNHFRIPQEKVTTYLSSAGVGRASEYIGRVHIWSLTAQAVLPYFATSKYGGYVIGGGGYFRKRTIFSQGKGCGNDDATYNCLQPISYANGAPGLDVGTGLAWRPLMLDSLKFFIEARYVWINNQPGSKPPAYAPAAQRTSFVPLTAGIRW